MIVADIISSTVHVFTVANMIATVITSVTVITVVVMVIEALPSSLLLLLVV